MASKEAREWAYFVVNKLGLPYTKTEIIQYAEEVGIYGVWDRFIASKETLI